MTMRRSVRVMLIVLLSGGAAAFEDIEAERQEMEEMRAEFEEMRAEIEAHIPTAVPPYMEQGTVMVPMRGIFEWLEAEVGYEAATQTITVHADEVDIRLRVGDRHALVHGERRAMAVPPVSVDGHTRVPLRFVSEALGAVTQWDPDEWIATISHRGKAGSLIVWADPTDATIFNAAALGYTRTLRELLDGGVYVDSRTEHEKTPLHFAAIWDRHDTAELLLEHGADIDAGDEGGITPLMYASVWSGLEIVALLLEHGADVNAKNPGGSTALHEASLFAGPEIVALLLEHGADANAQVTAEDAEGFTPLILASMYAGPETVALLLDYGADVNAAEAEGVTPLMVASLFAGPETVALLLEHGADVNAKVHGETALHGAAIAGRTDVVELLIDQGSDINTRGDEGKTPLDYAVEEGHEETAELLRRHGAEE